MDDLGRALARVTETRQAERRAREELHDLIRHEIATGPRGTQAELARRTGYTRERLRQIVETGTDPTGARNHPHDLPGRSVTNDAIAESVPSPTSATSPPLTPTQAWQAMVPELEPLTPPADTAERLLLLLHYSIDWDTSWVAEPRYRITYWDKQLPGRVRRAAYRADTLDRWWSGVSTMLGAPAPRQPERRMELASLLRQPSLPVIAAFSEELPARILRVRIISEAARQRRAATQ